VHRIREKQTTLASTIDTAKRAEHERELALSMQRPAQMLDELKTQFQRMMDNQSDEMKLLVK